MLLADELPPDLFALRDAGAMIYRGQSLRPPQMVWLKQAAQAAVSWEQALISTASRLRDPELVAILIRLGLHKPGRWKAIRSQMPAELLPRFESLGPRKLHRFVTFDHTHIMETEEGWLHCKTGEVISEIVIRIKRVVRIRPKAKKVSFLIHSGYAIYRNQKFRWRIKCSRGGSLIDQIENRILASGLGVPRISPSWRERLLKLAMRFSAPRVLERRKDRNRGQERRPIT